ncbi:hypothetical protein [Mycolicibacterium sp. 050158]|nr:hypothetical protein [Mycolicibacterium sp. 050158]MDX1893093.1 hypothetical protein [Mycolicibacterium sp. 050158]
MSTLFLRKGSGVGAAVVALLGSSTAAGHAESVDVPDVVRQVTTIDGWR